MWTLYIVVCFFFLDSCLIDKQNMIGLLDDFCICWLSSWPCKDLEECKWMNEWMNITQKKTCSNAALSKIHTDCPQTHLGTTTNNQWLITWLTAWHRIYYYYLLIINCPHFTQDLSIFQSLPHSIHVLQYTCPMGHHWHCAVCLQNNNNKKTYYSTPPCYRRKVSWKCVLIEKFQNRSSIFLLAPTL
jgi:hypothetical protein